ncbi:hypothetical protein GW932_02230 [archaeon]|nr:hypothetical protein [archaeon]
MKYKSILFFIGLALIASAILSFIPIEKACGQEETGCYKVQASNYDEVFGMKNAHLGLAAFVALFIINFSHIKKPTKRKKQFLTLGLTLGSCLGVYFLYLQFFVIHATCPYCLTTDLGVITSLAILLFAGDGKYKIK